MDAVGPEVRVGVPDGEALMLGESLVDGDFEG